MTGEVKPRYVGSCLPSIDSAFQYWNGCKLKKGKFRLDIRKKFFTMRVVKHWPRLPREAVAALSLAVFTARLDGALSNMGWWKMSLLMARGNGTR